jgi:hypothetical protein
LREKPGVAHCRPGRRRAAKEMAIHLDHIEETTRRTMKGK